MADQTQRLEIATVKAEVGSNILYRFANDPAANAEIPTEAGDIPNLKQVILQLQEDGAEKISFATTIYPTTAAGIAATTNGAIFLVRSADPDEIYAVYSNTAGVAVDTGKRALSATAIQTAMDAALESANAAEDSADLAKSRTDRFLAPSATDPELRDDGTTLQIGDRYVNTVDQAEYIYKTDGWALNDSLVAVEAIADVTDPTKGAALVGFDEETVDSVLLNAKALASYAVLRSYSGRATTVRVRESGRAGLFALDSVDTTTPDNGGTTLVGVSGRRWKRIFSGLADVRWFGASESISDNADALTAAAASGLPLLLSGKFQVKRQLLGQGSLLLIGNGRENSSITWAPDSTSIGWLQTPTSLNQQIRIQDFELISAAPLTGLMYYSSWSGLSGYTTLTNFSYKFIAKRVVVRQTGVGTFTKGIELNNIFGGVIEHCHVYGVTPVGSRASDGFATTHLIHISNDGSASNTVGMKFYNNHGYYGRYGVLLDDLEGLDYVGNDMQVCWDGLTIQNVIRKVNQYRISGNHFGCDNSSIVAKNARSVLISGSNEFSWGSNRANGAIIDMISIVSVEDLQITDNTLRGNGAIATYGHSIYGARVDGTTDNLTVYGLIDNNRFRDLTAAAVQEVNTTSLQFGISNQFNNVATRLVNNKGAGAQQQLKYGSGPHTNPSGVGPLLLLTAIGGSQLALNRDAAGSMQTFHIAGGTAVGVISSTSTATTYGTSSDMTLKEDVGEIPIDDAFRIMQAINFHKFNWKINGEEDIGVFAQELYEIYPKAVIKGGWKLLDGSDAAEGAEGAHYEGWAVDYSKLVTPIARCLQGVMDRLSKLESGQ